MLHNISFQNYKAFSIGKIKLKPITILLGANSVGKSSLIQLILLLQQTAQSDDTYRSALRLHGGSVNLGEGLNLIHKRDINTPLGLSFEIESANFNDSLKNDVLYDLINELSSTYLSIRSRIPKDTKLKSLLTEKTISSLKKNGDLSRGARKLGIRTEFEKDTFVNLIDSLIEVVEFIPEEELGNQIHPDFFLMRYLGNRIRLHEQGLRLDRYKNYRNDYIRIFEYLKSLNDSKGDSKYEISYLMKVSGNSLYVSSMKIVNANKVILKLDFIEATQGRLELHSIESDYFEDIDLTKKEFKYLRRIVSYPTTLFSLCDRDDYATNSDTYPILARLISHITSMTSQLVASYFEGEKINYVGPLRAHPKRYYILDKAKTNVSVDMFDGDAIAEILKDNNKLTNKVNTWLKKFNLKVSVQELHNVIHRLVIEQNTLDLDITDVGFGISQILPVIIQGFLSDDSSTTLIEQPEIHLHPKMQADLADLFIDISKGNGKRRKYFLIETHSEYLLKRLRRRISEGVISPNDVAIYLIDPQLNGAGALIKELEIEKKGHFEWPIDFYGGELLNDTVEFLKNQSKGVD
ncbi:AAA family ATPase [Leptospira noguchii]|uniref:AAA domain protein n=1 Tax=Leptospira noguchii TaxID=28182 RepID=M6VIF9_9LEPT|nr:AAA family ATPase [Leptospira noguchii]EMO54836.1 AAA domain protein [Leptospira noguchii]